MIKRNALFLLTVIGLGLTTGCAGGAEPAPNLKLTRTVISPATEETTAPTPTRKVTETPTPENQQPPVDLDTSSHPAARARTDLARRLRIKSGQIEVVKAVSRGIDAEVRSCLDRAPEPDKLLNDQEEIQWIVLAVGGKRYHYIGVGELIVYCDR